MFIYLILPLIFILTMLMQPQLCIEAFTNGLKVWAFSVVPSLLPFAFATKLIMSSLASTPISRPNIVSKLFNAPPSSIKVLFLSLLCGYPIGAKLVCDLYVSKSIDSNQALKIATFTSFASPLFILGAIGIKFIANSDIALLIWICHIIATILNGLLFRNFFYSDYKSIPQLSSEKLSIGQAMVEAINASLVAGGFIAFAFVINAIIRHLPFIDALTATQNGNIFISYLSGIIEMTSGVSCINNYANIKVSAILITSLITFGGFSVLLQNHAYYSKCNIKFRYVILIKLTQAAIATILCFIAINLLY